MVNTTASNKIPEWQWERVYPDKKGIVTIVFDEKLRRKMECRRLNALIKEYSKGNYGN